MNRELKIVGYSVLFYASIVSITSWMGDNGLYLLLIHSGLIGISCAALALMLVKIRGISDVIIAAVLVLWCYVISWVLIALLW